MRPKDLTALRTNLPTDTTGQASDQAQPWLLHSLPVNALNFCSFAMCNAIPDPALQGDAIPQMIASPNGLDEGGIDIFHLPSENRISQLRSDKASPTGMVMAVSLFYNDADLSPELLLVSGHEDGRIILHAHQGPLADTSRPGGWRKLAIYKAHTQPVLSLATLPSQTHFLTSSADATITKFAFPVHLVVPVEEPKPEKAINTKHAGQQGLRIRSDGKVFATAGWDGRVRVYSCKTLKELAVLKWHQVGVYSTAFAEIDTDPETVVSSASDAANEIATTTNALDMIKLAREEKARRTHWLAAGGKDGKISLWDIY